jgi:superfamily II DNA or RNA helicase
MSDTILICKKNHSSILVSADPGIEAEIREEFSFFVPNYKFMPAYKNRMWDGKIYLLESRTRRFPAGLITELATFARSRGYTLEFDSSGLPAQETEDVEADFDFPLYSKGNSIEIRDYQRDAVSHFVQNKRGILLSPTGSGKSLMIYLLLRNFADHRFLIVVPTTNLVEQMYSDFADYSSTDSTFDVNDDTVHRIYAGKDKNIGDARVVISTWQSIHRFPRVWFEQFTGVIGDEAHTFKAKSLNHILNSCVNADVRVGTTGTLDGTQVHEMILRGLFGPIYRATTTKDLIDKNTLSETLINVISLQYSKQECAHVAKVASKYSDEIAYLVAHERRNRFLINLALAQTCNTLLLYNFVETHGIPLRDLAHERNPDKRPIYFISGNIDAAEREQIRHKMEADNNTLLIASLGTFSTGINIRNLHNIIFASPTKSQIRVLQSIGRGLRKHGENSHLQIFDIIDNLTGKRKRKNYALKHGIERARIYAQEQFDFKVTEVPFE